MGAKYPDMWHYNHMLDPQSTSPGSIMPAYTWLYDTKLDLSHTSAKLKTFKELFNAPYSDAEVQNAVRDAQAQAAKIAEGLSAQGAKMDIRDLKIVAVIAYLQRLGTDIKGEKGAQ